MKIAIVLASAALLVMPSIAAAQNTPIDRADRPGHMTAAKSPPGSGESQLQGASDNQRAIDAEMKRIDRMMMICKGC